MSLLKLNERWLRFYNVCSLQLSGRLGVWWAEGTVRVGVMWAWRSLPSLHLEYSWRRESRGNRGAVNKSRPGLIIAVARARTHTFTHTDWPLLGKIEKPSFSAIFHFLNDDANEKIYSGYFCFVVFLSRGVWRWWGYFNFSMSNQVRPTGGRILNTPPPRPASNTQWVDIIMRSTFV